MMERRTLTAHVLLFLILGLGVGCGTVVTKLGLAGTNPIVFAFYRNVAAAALLLPAAWWLERRPCLPGCGGKDADALKIVGVGCLLFTTNLFYTLGLKLSDGVVGAAWQVTGPVFTAAYAMCLGREKPTVLKCCGFLVAVGGASFVLLFRTGDVTGGGNNSNTSNTSKASNSSSPNTSLPRPALNAPPSTYFAGNMCFLVNVNAYALYSICAKPLLQRYPALTLTTWSFALVSVLMLAAVLITSADPTLHAFVCDDCGAAAAAAGGATLGDWAIPTPMAALALVVMILIFSVGQYSVVNWANTFVQTSKITLYMTFQPAIAVAFTMVLLVSGYDQHAGAAGGGGGGRGGGGGGGTKHPALQPPGPNLAGVVGIVLGLCMVLYEDLVGAGGERRPVGEGGGDTSTTRLLMPPDSSLYQEGYVDVNVKADANTKCGQRKKSNTNV